MEYRPECRWVGVEVRGWGRVREGMGRLGWVGQGRKGAG